MEKTEIILQDDGTLIERLVKERELDAGQQILDNLTENVTRTIREVAFIPNWGKLHANVGLYDTVWTVPIDRIPLHARFKLVQGVMVPVFASSSDLEMPLVWKAPTGVKLAFVVITRYEEDALSLYGNTCLCPKFTSASRVERHTALMHDRNSAQNNGCKRRARIEGVASTKPESMDCWHW